MASMRGVLGKHSAVFGVCPAGLRGDADIVGSKVYLRYPAAEAASQRLNKETGLKYEVVMFAEFAKGRLENAPTRRNENGTK